MSGGANNDLFDVATMNESNLAHLQNKFAFIETANKKFENFQTISGQRGITVQFKLPTRFTSTNSLVASFQGVTDRYLTMNVQQEGSVSYDLDVTQLVYNIDEYENDYGKGAMLELGTKIEANVAQICERVPYRFYGDGRTPITSQVELATAIAFMENFGVAKGGYEGYLSNLTYPQIVNAAFNQQQIEANNRRAYSWEIGEFADCMWYKSNLLPTHTAGTEGQQASTLTVVSVVQNAEGGVTSIVFSGCNSASDADSVKEHDSFQFSDGVSGYENVRFRTFIGHEPSECPVQFRATADAASTGGSQVTVTIDPPLQATAGVNQNITTPIVAGMQCTVLPSHRCGLITCGKPIFLAMPKLPPQRPYDHAVTQDEDSGASIRMTTGAVFGQNQYGTIHDSLWDKAAPPEYLLKVALPL